MTKKTAVVGALVVVILGAVVGLLLWLRTSDGPVLVLRPKSGISTDTQKTWFIAPRSTDTLEAAGDGGSMVKSGTDRWLRKALMRPVKTLTCDKKSDVVGLTFFNAVGDKERITAELDPVSSALSWKYYDTQGSTGVTKSTSGGGDKTLPSEFLRLVNYANCRFASHPDVEVAVEEEVLIEFGTP